VAIEHVADRFGFGEEWHAIRHRNREGRIGALLGIGWLDDDRKTIFFIQNQ